MTGVFCKFSKFNRELEVQVTRRSLSLVKFAVGFFFFFLVIGVEGLAGPMMMPESHGHTQQPRLVMKNMAVSSACSVAIGARVGV